MINRENTTWKTEVSAMHDFIMFSYCVCFLGQPMCSSFGSFYATECFQNKYSCLI